MYLRILSLCACSLAACVGGDDVPPQAMADPCMPVLLVAAAGTTDAEQGSLADAAALWNAVAPLRIGVDAAGAADAAAGATTIPVRFTAAPLAFLGAYEPDEKDVVVNSEIPDEPARAIVLAHELGHAFGLVHVSGRPSVMNASNSTVAPNAGDAAALAALWGSCAD